MKASMEITSNVDTNLANFVNMKDMTYGVFKHVTIIIYIFQSNL
jgi:hypothetical protein